MSTAPAIKMVPSHERCTLAVYYTRAGIPVKCGKPALAKIQGGGPLCKDHLEKVMDRIAEEAVHATTKANTP